MLSEVFIRIPNVIIHNIFVCEVILPRRYFDSRPRDVYFVFKYYNGGSLEIRIYLFFFLCPEKIRFIGRGVRFDEYINRAIIIYYRQINHYITLYYISKKIQSAEWQNNDSFIPTKMIVLYYFNFTRRVCEQKIPTRYTIIQSERFSYIV